MLQRKRQSTYLGSDKEPASKTRCVATLQPYSGWKSLASVQVIFYTLWTLALPTSSMLWKSVQMEFSRGSKKGKNTPSNKILQKKSLLKKLIESVPAVDSHHCRKGTDQNPTQIQFVHQLNEPSGCWKKNEQGVLAGVQWLLPSHSLQTITLLSIDRTKTSAYCVHSYVNDEETNSLSTKMKEKFREHQKRRKESRAEKDGDKKEPKLTEVFLWRHLTCRLFSRHHVLPLHKSLQEKTRCIQLICLFLGW